MNAPFFKLLPADAIRSFRRICALAGSCLACTALLAAPESLRVTARDANSSTVEWTERLTNAVTGQVTQQNHSYVTVGTGLNYQDESGTWRESQDVIELLPDGSAAALRGQHKIHFSPNLNTAGVISLTTVRNRVFRSHPLALYYLNAQTGERALVARVKDSIGELHPPNQLVYPDCLEGAKADYRVTYSKSGIEADLVLLEQLPPPEALFGTSRSVRLEWVTEFLDPPAPQINTRTLKQETDPALRQSMAEPDLIDETLDFGDAWFPLGRAFDWDGATHSETNTAAEIRVFDPASNTNQVPVAKRWLSVDQRNVMVESVDWSDITPKLHALPQAGRVASASDLKDRVSKGRQLPVTNVAAKRSAEPMRVAAARYQAKGFVLDYVDVTGGTSYTFASEVTYYISSSASFSGTVTFQPNCVIKLASNGYLLLYGPIVCNGTIASPSILTSKDDDLYGDSILSSTRNPVYAANPAMWIYYVSFSTTIQGVKIRWANKAVQYDANTWLSHTFRDSRFEQCDNGIYVNNCDVSLVNVTKCGIQTPTGPEGWKYFSGTMTEDCVGDTDSDGLPDSWEITQFGNITSQNGTGDPDADGLTNVQEYQRGTNPTVADTDGDGMPDGWEVQYGLNPLANDASGDPDNDGLTNLQEYQRGYNPMQWDSNGNGVSDGYEDYDGDGLANLMEGAFGTNPWSFDDVNGNGVADWKEDSDGDGLPDAYERNISLTNPTVAEPAPVLPNPLDICPIVP